MTDCRNCGTRLDSNYCPDCGQKDIDLERPLWDLLGEVLRESFDLDGRAVRTLRVLLLRPGALTVEFLSGHRKRYTPPFRLYLVISVTFFLVATWMAMRGVLLETGQDLSEHAPGQASFLGDELPRLMFVFLPLFALFLKIVFWRRLFFDHLIYSLHLHSAAFIVMALLLPLEQAANWHWVPLVAQLAIFGYLLAYVAISIKRVYRCSWVGSVVRSVVVLFGYIVLLSLVIEASSTFAIISD